MAENSALHFSKTYLNPVYPNSFPDPYILKFCGEYYAYSTGFWHDGKVFGVLHSRDLIAWTPLGGAMQPIEHDPPFYWAPEVSYSNGKFYLYYSVGNEQLMEIRVAVSESPAGGFIDSGKILTSEDFAIDPHIFTDDNGKRYLFYATDFLEHTHIGTGTVVDEMIDWHTLAGDPHPVTRAKYDWQVYDPFRKEKGGVRWHTVEGPFVLNRKGTYYEMFSGGNWKNVSYGVSFAITDDIDNKEEWGQFSDGEKISPVLRTIPGLVTGPGHNSVIRGPNNRELYCIYHCWVENERVMAIDRMDFAGKRIFVSGATHTEQVAPFSPACADFFEAKSLSGIWSLINGQMVSEISGKSESVCAEQAESFLCEFSLRAVEVLNENSSFGSRLYNKTEKTLEFLIFPARNRAEIIWFESREEIRRIFELPEDFVFTSFHLLRIETDRKRVRVSLDKHIIQFESILENISSSIAIVSENTKAAFSGFAFTKGFEDLFDGPYTEPEKYDWQKLTSTGAWSIEEQQLFLSSRDGLETIVIKGELYKDYEYVVNIRFVESRGDDPTYGFLLLHNEMDVLLRFKVQQEDDRFYLMTEDGSVKFLLPAGFERENYHQFRFLSTADTILLQLEGVTLGEITKIEKETRIALFCQNALIAVEMVRLTVL